MIDRKRFFDSVRASFGALNVDQVNGFTAILDEFERRRGEFSTFDLADILATAWWETGKTMQPVREAFYIGNYAKAEAWRKRNLRYWPYYGRGLVQLTWRRNYELAGKKRGVDFVKFPDRVMEMEHAVAIMFDGMKEGWFTGKALDDYIDDIDESDAEDLREYINARRIINGTDKATTIGRIALLFEKAIKVADKTAKPPAPVPEPVKPIPPVVPVSGNVAAGSAVVAGGAGAVAAMASGRWGLAIFIGLLAFVAAGAAYIVLRKKGK
jgi:predicted chitinase